MVLFEGKINMEASTHEKSKTSLFFIEFMIALTFFSVAAAICVSIFVSTHLQSNNSADLSWAVIATQNAAEVYKAYSGDLDQVAVIFPGKIEDKKLTAFFDESGNSTDADSAYYSLYIAQNEQGENGLVSARISACRADTCIIEISVSKALNWIGGGK